MDSLAFLQRQDCIHTTRILGHPLPIPLDILTCIAVNHTPLLWSYTRIYHIRSRLFCFRTDKTCNKLVDTDEADCRESHGFELVQFYIHKSCNPLSRSNNHLDNWLGTRLQDNKPAQVLVDSGKYCSQFRLI